MEQLFAGVREFNATDYQEYKELFGRIGKEQKPHTLFIGCSDSRVLPNLITRTLPGDLFVIRNIANIVPTYRETEEYAATTAAIEYGVNILGVENILVCGHSNCGGCNALFFDKERLSHLPHTRKWLELADGVRQKVEQEHYSSVQEREWKTEQLNIIEQMNHLLTYPYIKEKFQRGTIRILGWYYIIESGAVFNYDQDQKLFIKIT